MVLIQGGLLKTLIWSVKVMSVFQSMPMKWSPDKFCFVPISARARKVQQYRLLLALIYFVQASTQIFYMWNGSTRYAKTHGVMGTAGYIMSLVSAYLTSRRPKEIVSITNDLIQFEEKNYGTKQTNLEELKEEDKDSKEGNESQNEGLMDNEDIQLDRGTWFTKRIIQIITITAYATISYHIGVFTFPCYPMVVGSWMIDQCQSNNVAGWEFELGKRLFVALWSFYNWWFIFPVVMFHGVCWLIQGQCIKMYISHFERELCYGRNKISGIPWHQYREIQVILAKHRVFNSEYLLITLLVTTIVGQTTCLIITFDYFRSGMNQVNDVGMLLVCMWCSGSCGSAITFIYGKLAEVHSVSTGALENLNSVIRLRKNKLVQRYLRSCPVLKIYLNYTSYTDAEIPLTAEDFVVDQTTSFLLLE